jgi:hypothetical protein
LIVIRTKKASFAPQVWSVICCGISALMLHSSLVSAQNKVGPQLEGPKRTSNGLVIKSSGAVQTPQTQAPSRFKTPTAAQYKGIQRTEASRAQKGDPRKELSRQKNFDVAGSNKKAGARDAKK